MLTVRLGRGLLRLAAGDRKCPGGAGAGTERGQSSMVKAEVKMMDKYKIG